MDKIIKKKLNKANIGKLKEYIRPILFYVLLLAVLWIISLKNYLLFHSVAELSGIVVACCIFVLAWNSRHVAKNSYILFIGIAYLFVAALDLLHTLAYEGMGVFEGYGSNLATQLWISARYIEGGSLLLAPFLIGRKLKGKYLLCGYTAVFFLLLAFIFKWDIFPTCFIEGSGLTPFKKASEYVIILLLGTSIGMLLRRRHMFEPSLLRFLIASIAVTIASEFAFTLYIDVTGIYNFIGHYLKIVSFYLIYRAVVETGLVSPLTVLFRDLKQREEEMTRLARFPDENPHPILRISDDCTILYANTASEPVLRTWEREVGQRLPEEYSQHAKEVFASGKPHTFEFSCYDGRIFLVTLAARVEEGYLNAYGIDITEREQMEEALKAEKEFTETALDAQTDTFFVFEPTTGKAVRWNKAFSKVSGYSDEEIRRMKVPDSYYNEEDLKKAGAAIEKILKEGTTTVELSLITKDGRTIPTEYTGSVIKEDKNKSLYIIAIGRDITDRRQMELVLKESEEKFRNLAEQSPNMIFIHQNGRIVYVNKKCEEIMGYNRDNFYAADFDFLNLIAPESEELMKNNFSRHMSGEEVPLVEYALITKEGKMIEAILTTKLITYGGQTAILGTVTDITRLKEAEKALRKSERELTIRNKIVETFLTVSDQEMYTEVLKVVMEALESKHGVFGYIDEDGAFVCPSMTTDIWDQCEMADKNYVFPREKWGGIWGRAMTEKKTLYSNKAFSVPQGHIPMLRALDVPILYQERLIGNLMVGNKETDYEKEDCELLEAIADKIAPILSARLEKDKWEKERKKARDELEIRVEERTAELAKSRETLRMLAGRLLSVQEEERRRLGRELHDDLTQRLAILAIDIGKMEGQLRSEPKVFAGKLKDIKGQIIELSADVHDISRQLHPSIIDDLGLRQAIQSECANFTKREGIEINYQSKDIPSLIPKQISVCLFRIVQEGLRNIAKHAKVKQAKVSLLSENKDIKLIIEDSGIGFDIEQARKIGLGLVSMQERVYLIRGNFTIKSELGRGTIIKVTAPLSGNQE